MASAPPNRPSPSDPSPETSGEKISLPFPEGHFHATVLRELRPGGHTRWIAKVLPKGGRAPVLVTVHAASPTIDRRLERVSGLWTSIGNGDLLPDIQRHGLLTEGPYKNLSCTVSAYLPGMDMHAVLAAMGATSPVPAAIESGRLRLLSIFSPSATLPTPVPRGIPLPFACALGMKVAENMQRLANVCSGRNKAGVVHRDIKPSNIILWRDPPRDASGGKTHGGPRLIDWKDLVRLEDGHPVDTGPDEVVGTPCYSAQSQLEGTKAPSLCWDQASLALTLLHLLSGREPPGGATANDLLRARERWFIALRGTMPDELWGFLRGIAAEKQTLLSWDALAAALGAFFDRHATQELKERMRGQEKGSLPLPERWGDGEEECDVQALWELYPSKPHSGIHRRLPPLPTESFSARTAALLLATGIVAATATIFGLMPSTQEKPLPDPKKALVKPPEKLTRSEVLKRMEGALERIGLGERAEFDPAAFERLPQDAAQRQAYLRKTYVTLTAPESPTLGFVFPEGDGFGEGKATQDVLLVRHEATMNSRKAWAYTLVEWTADGPPKRTTYVFPPGERASFSRPGKLPSIHPFNTDLLQALGTGTPGRRLLEEQSKPLPATEYLPKKLTPYIGYLPGFPMQQTYWARIASGNVFEELRLDCEAWQKGEVILPKRNDSR